MKKIITLFTIFLSTIAFSQEMTTKKDRIYVEGKQLSDKEVKTLLTSNKEALALFKSSRTKRSWGGFLLGFGGGLIITDLILGATADIKYPTEATYIGLASLIISIPVLSGKNKKMNNAVTIYNEGLKKSTVNDSNSELNIIANQSGYGLQFQF